MVSIAAVSGARRFETVSKVATFLSATDTDVDQLLQEGRLQGTILAVLKGKGVNITPSIKNSVQEMVRSLEPKNPTASIGRESDSHLTSDATATIMFTDIVGSSSMMARLGDKAGHQVLRIHDEIIRHEVVGHDGLEVKSLGDGFMLTFRSVGRGLACAVAVQTDIDLYNNKNTNTNTRISVRMGLSVGEPIQDSEDLFGMSVIIAARIAGKARGGQVLVSEVAHALASSSGDFRFRPVGPVELKGIVGSHELYEVLWDLK